MIPRRIALTLAIVAIALGSSGCANSGRPQSSAEPVSSNEVVGTLVALKDDRPVDGGIDLTLQTDSGARETVRVPSMFIAPPRDSIRVMHDVVDSSMVGDRLRARGTRDETGALRAEMLERLSR
jgi:hypothetical protein